MGLSDDSQRVPQSEGTEVEDNWVHRAANMRCKTCMGYVSKKLAHGGISKVGRCRARPPTMRGFPVVFETDWCLEHKLDENRVDLV